MSGVRVVCSGCGAEVDPARALPFQCPNAVEDDGIDHVLVRHLTGPALPFPGPADNNLSGTNPFIRYRHLTLSYHLAMQAGLSDTDYLALVRDLDDAVSTVDGHGFRVTPFAPVPALAEPAGAPEGGRIWVKDETGNVSGSHKARHLMGVMIYLEVLERAGLPLAEGLRDRRLAIASCGNAALAAAVIAKAANWPLDVFIPPDAEEPVVRRLKELGAECHVMHRQEGQAGDPCYHGFREAVARGSLPFGVQGNEVGLAIEGGQTLGWEMADALREAGTELDLLAVHVGGGALGSACYRGLQEAQAARVIKRLPRFFTVQTTGAYPMKQAFTYFLGEADPGDLPGSLRRAARNRADYMKPWPAEPHSIAHGILDDETYDWLALVEAMATTDGDVLVVSEDRLRQANRLGTEAGYAVSHTGSAGLAGLMDALTGRMPDAANAAVLFTGVERS